MREDEIQNVSRFLPAQCKKSLVRRPDLSKWSAGLAYSQRHGCICPSARRRELHIDSPVNYRAKIVMVAVVMHDTSLMAYNFSI